jgi:hypothetical protein
MSLIHPPDGSSVSLRSAQDEAHLDALTHRAWSLRERDRTQTRHLVQQVFNATNTPILHAQAKIVLAYIAWREGHLAEALEAIQPAMVTVREQNALFWLARALNA